MDTEIEKFLANMFELKRNNLYCDVVLVATADNTRIPVHRVVLHAASEYFQKLLTTAMKEKNASEIALEGVAGVALEQLIEFCYTRKITIDASNAVDILAVAQLLRFADIVKMCEKWIPIAGNYMIAVGPTSAAGDDQISSYVIATNVWREPVQTIAGMHDSHLHFIDNCLYFIAGNAVKSMPLSTMQLETKKAPQYYRYGFTSVADGQYVYLIGGDLATGGSSKSVERYDTKKDEWAEMAELNQDRFAASAEVLAGKVYVVGGVSDGVMSDLRSVERYDPETNRWTEVAQLNVARRGHGCCTVRDSIYAVGGMESKQRLASIEKYDAQINQWTIIPFQLDIPLAFFGISVLDDWIYVVGGNKGSGQSSDAVRRINVSDGKIDNLAATEQKVKHCVMIP